MKRPALNDNGLRRQAGEGESCGAALFCSGQLRGRVPASGVGGGVYGWLCIDVVAKLF